MFDPRPLIPDPVPPGWLMTCPHCGLHGIAVTLIRAEADTLCRVHDSIHHGGNPTAHTIAAEAAPGQDVTGGVR